MLSISVRPDRPICHTVDYSERLFEDTHQDVDDLQRTARKKNWIDEDCRRAILNRSFGTIRTIRLSTQYWRNESYMATEKPIAHIHTLDDDVNLPYPSLYPLSLCVKAAVEHGYENVRKIAVFTI